MILESWSRRNWPNLTPNFRHQISEDFLNQIFMMLDGGSTNGKDKSEAMGSGVSSLKFQFTGVSSRSNDVFEPDDDDVDDG